MKQITVTTILFWIAFIAFLATSLPHVAWLYHLFEPDKSLAWWVLSYGIAASIDIMLAWLSWSNANSPKRTGKGVTVAFILALAVLSWYANYLYVLDHQPYQAPSIWSIDMGFGLTTGFITPIIVSAIPLFVIGYTYMLGQLNAVKSETLEEKAVRLEYEKRFKDRIRQAQKGRFIRVIGESITLAQSELKKVFSDGKTISNLPPKTSKQEALSHDTGELDTFEGRKTATVQELAINYGVSVRLLNNRIADKTIKTAPRNPTLVILSSFHKWFSEQGKNQSEDEVKPEQNDGSAAE